MPSYWARILQKIRWRITHTRKFPKADLLSCLLNLADRGFEPREVLDIGANKGKWSRRVKWVFPDAHITLVEPQAEMQPYLDAFCRKHRNCQWIQAGCGDRVGKQVFTVVPDTVSSSFAITPEHARRHGWERREVPVVTVDHLVAEGKCGIPDILKVDAEGYESQILRGAESVLGKVELIFLEADFFRDEDYGSSLYSLLKQMDDYGYRLYDFTWFGKRPLDGAIGLAEVAFARYRGILRESHGWGRAA